MEKKSDIDILQDKLLGPECVCGERNCPDKSLTHMIAKYMEDFMNYYPRSSAQIIGLESECQFPE